MQDVGDTPEAGRPSDAASGSSDKKIDRRRAMLRAAALGSAAIFTVRAGGAQAATSALTCSVPVPDSSNSNKWIKSDGSLVKKNSKNSYPGPSQPLAGEDVKNALKYGTNYPGYDDDHTNAYNNYIQNLTMGKEGYTCYSSLQSPSHM